MNFWLVLVGYEAAWLAAVIGAGDGLWWPGVLATALFAAWRFAASPQRRVEARLVGTALALGIVFDAALVWMGLVRYAAARPWPAVPAWMAALWVAFALTIVPLFGYLHARPWLAALLGAVGGPLAYLGAARGWGAVALPSPAWHALAVLAIGWGIALPLLCSLARRWRNTQALSAKLATGSAP